jgi:hypothetical protein
MHIKSYIDVGETTHEVALIEIVQSLRKLNNEPKPAERETSSVEVLDNIPMTFNYDYFEEQTERLFELAITSNNAISAVKFWQNALCEWHNNEQHIDPVAWVELVFSSYCKLTNAQQALIGITPKGQQIVGISHNWSYSDIVVKVN